MSIHPTPAPMMHPQRGANGFGSGHRQPGLQPLRPVVGAARAGAWVMMGLAMMSTALTLAVHRAAQGTDLDRLQDLQILAARIELLTPVGGLFAFIVGCRWLARARRNTVLLPPFRHPTLGPAWAWWGWVVPIVSWWFPRTVVLEVWADPQPGSPARRLVNRWWGWWLAALVIGILPSRLSDYDGTSTDALVVLSLLHTVCLGLALHAWLELLSRITADQDEVIGASAPPHLEWPVTG